MKRTLLTFSLTLLLLSGILASLIAWNWDELTGASTEAGVPDERQLLGRWNGDDDSLEFLKGGIFRATIKESRVSLEGTYAVDKDHLQIDITTPGKELRRTVRFNVEGNAMLLLFFPDGAKVYSRIKEDG